MGRRHALETQDERAGGLGGGRRVRYGEELRVIRVPDVVVNCQQELSPRFDHWRAVGGRHHVVLAPPRAVLDDGAHVSCRGAARFHLSLSLVSRFWYLRRILD